MTDPDILLAAFGTRAVTDMGWLVTDSHDFGWHFFRRDAGLSPDVGNLLLRRHAAHLSAHAVTSFAHEADSVERAVILRSTPPRET